MLTQDDFKRVVSSTPLISIDFVVRNVEGEILLGKRTNRPAQGVWFVPGGRVLKDESLEKAFKRLLKVELSLNLQQVTVKSLGIYQHMYDDSFFGTDFGTHYIVTAYEVSLKTALGVLPVCQHSQYRWLSVTELLNDKKVHKHSKWYFQAGTQADHSFIT